MTPAWCRGQNTGELRAKPSIRIPATAIVCIAVSLVAFLAAIRGVILGLMPLPRSATWALARILVGTFYDFVFVGALTAATLGLLWWCRSKPARRRLIVISYVVAATGTLLVAFVNIENVRLLGGPFTYQWFYYSDFLASKEARDAITATVDWRFAFWAAALPLSLYASSATLFLTASWIFRRAFSPRAVVLTGTVLAFAYVLTAGSLISRSAWAHTKVANPIVAFATSYFWETPAIFTMDTPVGAEDFRSVVGLPGEGHSMAPRSAPPISNVVLYVMESVPAEYVGAYDSSHGATPVLDDRHDSSLIFEDIYAHVPNSPKALVALLLSIYGHIGYTDVTSEHPDIAAPSLSSELKRRGYRTAMFYGSDLRYANQQEFLAGRGFDKIEDYRSRDCSIPTFIDTLKEEDFLEGSADHCTASALGSWLRVAPSAPFLAVLWTMQTHYPYFVTGEQRDFGVKDQSLNRYLNALHESDRALGEILTTLDDEGLTDSTVVVVVGDHGESFGDHGQRGHGSSIYEENVHVPLILINPRLFHGESKPVVGNLVDVSPTIVDLLDLPVVPEWQGRSLFATRRSRRAYFFSTWTNLIFGYREGDRKYILNATANRYEIYDLKADPQETVNLATGSPAETLPIQHQLAAWVQYDARLLDRMIETRTREP